MTGAVPQPATADAWWRQAVVYQVYIRSFADSDGDGVGDLAGIRARLPHLVDLGVDALWVTPFYPSPMADHGYDVADPMDVDPTFGSLADLDALVADAHRLRLRVIVDVVPNHTSSKHPWFKAAVADPASPLRERYLFRDAPPDGGLPNNWVSVFGGPAWTREPAGDQLYLHLFAPEQPDLNWRNPDVHAYWEGVLRFWLDRGVDGFRIDVAHGLYKNTDLADNPSRTAGPPGAEHLHGIGDINSWNQPEVHGVYRRWREICDSYPGDRMMVGEVFLFDIDAVSRYVGPHGLHQAFNFVVMGQQFAAEPLRSAIELSLERFAAHGSLPTWVLSNHDLIRHVTRYGGGAPGRERALAATGFLLGLPGSPYLYQGEELALEQVPIAPELRQDPIWERSGHTVEGRDGCRTPMPWTGDPPGYGFTTAARAWLPFGPEDGSRNVTAEAGDPASPYAVYQRLLRARRAVLPTLAEEVVWLDVPPGALGILRAPSSGEVGLAAVLNTSDAPVHLQLPAVLGSVSLLVATGDASTDRDGAASLPARSTAWFALCADLSVGST